MTQESVRMWVCRLWAVCVVQESLEVWARSWLVSKFRSPYMCRVSVRDDRWCMVPSLTQTMMSRVPAWKCVYDPWCDGLVYSETTPPLVTRLTVLTAALTTSLVVVWAPRLLIYRPSNSLLLWTRRNTPRRVLQLAAVAAVLQLFLDHWIFLLLVPPNLMLTRGVSFGAFCCSVLLATGVLLAQLRHSQRGLHSTHSLAVCDVPPRRPTADGDDTGAFLMPSSLPETYHHLLSNRAA